MTLPLDYTERVYAGVLGKVIGVYLGRPFEGWSHDLIADRLGDINYYVHDELNVPLIVTDDDISGTFTFIRALEDYGCSRDITPAQIGHSWLNYIIEGETILWWGGMGNSTEHTAYLRLKSGIDAPESGSMALNGKVVSEQIGSQIFIDGWGMVVPGDPEQAADFARRAGSVSHDGEAIYGAQVVAAMASLAFVESDIDKLIDGAVATVPRESLISTMIDQIREWHAAEPDWRAARDSLDRVYGYDVYGGNCHMIPNHGLIMLSLLYGDDDFQKSLMVVNTAGWDTDCNSGNLGCLMGIKNGLAGIDAGPDWRGPVADRLFLPTADGGRAISDAAQEAIRLVNMGRKLAGEGPLEPKRGARFHFEMAGSMQGFVSDDSTEAEGVIDLENVEGHSETGSRSLAIRFRRLAPGRTARAETATFIPSREVARYFDKRGYRLLASPTIYGGQSLRARLVADDSNPDPVEASVYLKHYDADDDLSRVDGERHQLEAGQAVEIEWVVPDTGGYPIAAVGVELTGSGGTSGSVYLDYMTWDGAPAVTLNRPVEREHNRLTRLNGPTMWKQAWIHGLDSERLGDLDYWPEPYRLIQNTGRGLLMQGTREWQDYTITARITPHMCRAAGVGVRVQGMGRYYALLVDGNGARVVRVFEGTDTVLAEAEGGWQNGVEYELSLEVVGNRLVASIDGSTVIETQDADNLYTGGAIALVCEEGRAGCNHVEVRPDGV